MNAVIREIGIGIKDLNGCGLDFYDFDFRVIYGEWTLLPFS